MNDEYDISQAFQRIEETLIKSMKRNLMKHLKEEEKLEFNWTAWQTEQLKALEIFKKQNKNLFKTDFNNINSDVEKLIKRCYENSNLAQEKEILEAIQNGNFKSSNRKINKLCNIYKNTKNQRIKKKQFARIYENVSQIEASFFKINTQKLNALIQEATGNLSKAETSILRYTNDQYRKIIYNAQVYANTGAGTIKQAVDMATQDFLSKGINSIEYSNGAMVNIAAYAEMAIRTANKRAMLQGEGAKRQEWRVYTVIVPNRGGGCPYCIKFQGKVFIDDVWSGGTEAESKKTGYPLLSLAIKQKLFHPNCKDTIVTYYSGISEKPIPPTKEELEEKIQNYKNEQKLKYIDRNIEKYKRLELGSIDEENIEKYHNKRLQWQDYKKRFKNNKDEIFYKNVTNSSNGGIIKEQPKKVIKSAKTFKIQQKDTLLNNFNKYKDIDISELTPDQRNLVVNYKMYKMDMGDEYLELAKKSNAKIVELENVKNRKSNYFDNTFESRYSNAKQYTTEQSNDLTNLYKNKLNELNINQKNSIADYTGIDFDDINRSLRTERKVNERLSKNIDNITDVLNNSTTVEDMIVHRHVEFDGASKFTGLKEYQLKDNKIEELNKILKGKECTDKAFISTSIRDFKDELREVVYDIYMPKGTKGLYINELSTNYKDIEYEFLLQRETKFKIQEVFKDTDGTLRIVMEVIENGI